MKFLFDDETFSFETLRSTSSDIGFAPESAGVHPLLAAGHRGAMAARVEAAWKFIENYTQYKSVWIDLY
jgi:hypothetical protein